MAAAARDDTMRGPPPSPAVSLSAPVTHGRPQSKNIEWEIPGMLRESTLHIAFIIVYCYDCSILLLLLL